MYGCIIVLMVFLIGIYFIFNIHMTDKKKEGYAERKVIRNQRKYKCPNVLVQEGNAYFLFNTKVSRVPGVNPIRFESLEDYTKFLDWQKSQNIHCPVLYLRKGYNAQGEKQYSVHPSPTDLKAGRQNSILDPAVVSSMDLIDASHNDPPYNKNSYPGFDPQDQYIGVKTPIDSINDTNEDGVSANPMNPNWGGQAYTQKLIDEGYYKGDEVYGYGDTPMD